ncbi:glycoside hydrolase family 5 protein [Pluteus cervinus]|uniref:Glycoside hydrolase family 5 protein n=1 Tax=Pluteus cervinus TaxID=181527 RepID=A0ACD3B5G7_9AGAR|nr:glycoside hydrolase family 5 protein [Pluteus cervinus]
MGFPCRLTRFALSWLLLLQTLLWSPLGVAAAQQCRLKSVNHGWYKGQPSSTTSSSGNGPTALPSGIAPGDDSDPPLPPFDYGNDKVRGVNLGGWLVLEPWITPSIFQNTGNDNVVDEFTFGSLLDGQTASSTLEQHWATWITEDDFIAISAAGLNHVRIPLGYWSVPLTSADTTVSTSPSPYIPGAWQYLIQGLTWARKHSIHVILDIHGAPGSQNGYDNSGQRTATPQWALDPNNILRTVDTIRFLAKNLQGYVDVLELLNEGAGFIDNNWMNAVRQYFEDGYGAVRSESGMVVMIGDAFVGVANWQGFLIQPDQGVIMDIHEYQIFSDPELNRSFDDHIAFACSSLPALVTFSATNLWTVIGEWSSAVTDCTQWLNGRGIGSRWDNSFAPSTGQFHGSCNGWTGDWHTFSDDYKTFLRKYWEVQVFMGESIQGWVYWTWKAENSDEWSYQKGLEGGWIPQDPTNRIYPNICG